MDDQKINELVQRILSVVNPVQIILFGSRASGDAHSDSDYDILIIAPSDQPSHFRRCKPVYAATCGLGISKDILWLTPEQVSAQLNNGSDALLKILQEGQVIYESKNKSTRPAEESAA